jgi:hypothetical protein
VHISAIKDNLLLYKNDYIYRENIYNEFVNKTIIKKAAVSSFIERKNGYLIELQFNIQI